MTELLTRRPCRPPHPDAVAAPTASSSQGARRVRPRAAAHARARWTTALRASAATTARPTASAPAGSPWTTGRSTRPPSPGTATATHARSTHWSFFVELRSRCCSPDDDPAGLPGGDRPPPWPAPRTSVHAAGGPSRRARCTPTSRRSRRHDRGPPLLRRQQRPARLRRRRIPRVRPRGRRARSGWCGWPPHRDQPPSRSAPASTTTRSTADELGEATLGPVRGRCCATWAWTRPTTSTCRSTPGSGGTSCRSPSPPRSPAAPGAPGRGRRRVPRAAVDPHVLQHHATRTSTTSRRRCRSSTWASCAGLSPAYMEATPAINDWLAGLIGERRDAARAAASRSSASGPRSATTGTPYEPRPTGTPPYRKMLAALWRESPVPRWRAGERLATMASLLHIDADGDVVRRARCIRASGLAPRMAAALPATPTCARCCTASTRTTWCSCRTARTSSWSSRDAPCRGRSSRTSPRRSP